MAIFLSTKHLYINNVTFFVYCNSTCNKNLSTVLKHESGVIVIHGESNQLLINSGVLL